MINNYDIMNLINQKQLIQQRIDSMIYGSIEIREKDYNKYIYVHYRENGKLISKYIGEYSDELHTLILNNNIEVKKLKKEVKLILKQLKELNYSDSELTPKVKLNIDFAKRNLVDTIYKQAILEDIATTFADTENIIEGGKVNNMTTDDVMKVVNLKHAWEFILNENVLLATQDLGLLCQINKLVEEGFYYNAGKLRSTPVNIGGTKWSPNIPIESVVVEELKSILEQKNSNVDKAINLLLYIMKKQIFIDGNKRTAVIFANHYLISTGSGLIVIPSELTAEYKKILVSYYESGNKKEIKKFLKDKCYIKI